MYSSWCNDLVYILSYQRMCDLLLNVQGGLRSTALAASWPRYSNKVLSVRVWVCHAVVHTDLGLRRRWCLVSDGISYGQCKLCVITVYLLKSIGSLLFAVKRVIMHYILISTKDTCVPVTWTAAWSHDTLTSRIWCVPSARLTLQLFRANFKITKLQLKIKHVKMGRLIFLNLCPQLGTCP